MADPTVHFRYDAATALRPAVVTPEGFLRVEGYVSRPGIYEYVNKPEDEAAGYGKVGTIRRELRPAEEVYGNDALSGFEGKSVTAGHPREMINAQNARAYEIGNVGPAARREDGGDRVIASMLVKDPATIKRVQKGELAELSPGYRTTIIKESGTDRRYATTGNPDGRYDVIQRDIAVNHLALVGHARGGSDLRVRLDGADDVAVERTELERHENDQQERNDMADMSAEEQVRALKVQLDGANKTAGERKDALDTAIAERDTATSKIRTLEEKVAALESRLSAGATAMETEAIAQQKERADAAETKLAELDARREADIRKAAETRLKAQAIMGPKWRCDGMNDRAVHAAVIGKLRPKDDTSDKVSAASLESRFDSLVEDHLDNARSLTRVGEVLTTNRQEIRLDSREARAKAWSDQALNPAAYAAAFGPKGA